MDDGENQRIAEGIDCESQNRFDAEFCAHDFESLLALTVGLCSISVARGAEVVALGASNTYGKGVQRGEDFPAQLEQLIRAKGVAVTVANAGINGDTTAGMLWRFDSVIAADTKVIVLQPGGNDRHKGFNAEDTKANVAAIKEKCAARHINVVMITNSKFPGLPHQADDVHLTPDGYRMLARELLPQVLVALRR